MEILIQATSTSPPENTAAAGVKPFSTSKSRADPGSSCTFEQVMKARKAEVEEAQEESAAAAAVAAANGAASQPIQVLATLDQSEAPVSTGINGVTGTTGQASLINSTAVTGNAASGQEPQIVPGETIPPVPVQPGALQTAAELPGLEGTIQTGLATTDPIGPEDLPKTTPDTPQQAATPEIPFTDGIGPDGLQQGALTTATSQTMQELPPPGAPAAAANTAGEESIQSETVTPAVQPAESSKSEPTSPNVKTVETSGKYEQEAVDRKRVSGTQMEEVESQATEKTNPAQENPVTPELARPNLDAARQAPLTREISPKMDSQAVAIAQQIQESLEATIRHGKTSLRIQLSPQELGAIDIRLVSSIHGVNLTVFAEQASTGRLLEAQINQLRQNLSEAGVQINNLNIHQNQSGQTHQGYSHQQGSQPQAGRSHRAPEQALHEESVALIGKPLRPERGVDYRV